MGRERGGGGVGGWDGGREEKEWVWFTWIEEKIERNGCVGGGRVRDTVKNTGIWNRNT